MSFGERLRELREELNMTQEDLGRMLGVSGRQAGNYEANKQFIKDEETFLKLIKRFNVSADYLLGLSNERNYIKYFASLKNYESLNIQDKKEVNNYIRYLIYKEKNGI